MNTITCKTFLIGLLAGVASVAFAQTELTLTDSIRVAGDTTTNSLGGGSTSALSVRSRSGTSGQEDLRWVSFFQYDISSLTVPEVNAPGFSATFEIDKDTNVGGTTIDVFIGRNDSGAWDSTSGSAYPLHNWGWNFETSTVTAQDGVFIFDFHNNDSPSGTTYSADVTTIVQDWVNGTETNNGLVLYYNGNGFTQSNISNPVLTVIPEPSSLVLLGLAGLAAMALRRRRK